jgi:hypothetical protein
MRDYTSLVILAVALTVGGTEINRLTNQKPVSLSPVLGGFLLGLMLFILGLVNETLATRFVYLVIVAGLLINGTATFKAITPKK